jgi:hypothetical protein
MKREEFKDAVPERSLGNGWMIIRKVIVYSRLRSCWVVEGKRTSQSKLLRKYLLAREGRLRVYFEESSTR